MPARRAAGCEDGAGPAGVRPAALASRLPPTRPEGASSCGRLLQSGGSHGAGSAVGSRRVRPSIGLPAHCVAVVRAARAEAGACRGGSARPTAADGGGLPGHSPCCATCGDGQLPACPDRPAAGDLAADFRIASRRLAARGAETDWCRNRMEAAPFSVAPAGMAGGRGEHHLVAPPAAAAAMLACAGSGRSWPRGQDRAAGLPPDSRRQHAVGRTAIRARRVTTDLLPMGASAWARLPTTGGSGLAADRSVPDDSPGGEAGLRCRVVGGSFRTAEDGTFPPSACLAPSRRAARAGLAGDGEPGSMGFPADSHQTGLSPGAETGLDLALADCLAREARRFGGVLPAAVARGGDGRIGRGASAGSAAAAGALSAGVGPGRLVAAQAEGRPASP